MFYVKLIIIKIVIFISSLFGKGSALPGAIAKKINFRFDLIKNLNEQSIIYIIGTNGKTTTTNLLYSLLESNNKKVICNNKGANLINGIYTLLLKNIHFNKKIDAEVILLEVDEKTIKQVVELLKPTDVIITNFFRDQLDRYGEIDLIVNEIINALPKNAKIYLNGDDPYIVYKFNDFSNKVFFGINILDSNMLVGKYEQEYNKTRDLIYCPNCLNKLTYEYFHYGHLGKFSCPNLCYDVNIKYQLDVYENYFIFNNEEYHLLKPLPLYFLFNIVAAISYISEHHLTLSELLNIIEAFKTPTGRNKIYKYNDSEIYLNLVKNVVGLEETIDYILDKYDQFDLLFCLNDNYADGKDISWIYDVDLNFFSTKINNLFVCGTRAYDMALRFELAGYDKNINVIENPVNCCETFLNIKDHQNKVIISNYTAIEKISNYVEGICK